MKLSNIKDIFNISSPRGGWEGALGGFFFMYALGIVSALCTTNGKLYDYAWAELLMWMCILTIFLAILPKWPQRIVRTLFYVIAYTVSIVDVYCFTKFEAAINPSILMLMSETDTREAGEFFSAYLSPDILLTNVGWVLLIMLLHILWAARHLLPKKYFSLFTFHFSLFTKKVLRFATVIIVGILLVVSCILSYTNLSQLYTLMTMPTIGDVEHKLTEKDRGEQFLPLYRLAFSLYANNLAAKQIDVLREVEKTVRVDSCSYTSPNIVLIIGEAYNRQHSQLYGYQHPTTPRQLELAKAGKLIPFTDVVAPWNLTSFVFKHIMSTYTVGDKGDWCDYPLFGEIFRKAGYHVTFLTNEFLYQAKQQVFDFSGGFFLNDPQLSAAQFDTRNKELHVFDEGLIQDYNNLTTNTQHPTPNTQHLLPHRGIEGSSNTLTIFHLIGQHQDYRIRCPKKKMHFTTDDYAYRTDLTNPRWKRNLCYYDNATLYNDSVVTEIINLFKDKDAIVIYMPDHGEEVHSRELPHFSGRMHSTTIVKRLAREEFEIPFWIYASQKYRSNHPDIWQQVKASSSRPYMTDALPHLLMYLAGIHCQYYRPDLNILSDKYNAKRPRILKHQVDYDVIMKNKE